MKVLLVLYFTIVILNCIVKILQSMHQAHNVSNVTLLMLLLLSNNSQHAVILPKDLI